MPSASASAGQHLLARGLITAEQLAWAESRQPSPPGGVAAALLEAGLVTEAQLVAAAADRLGVGFVDLDASPPNNAALLPVVVAHRHRIVPVLSEAGTLTVAMADPTDRDAICRITADAGMPVRGVAAVPGAIDRALERLYRSSGAGQPGAGSTLDELLYEVVRVGGSDLHLSAGRPPGARIDGDILPLTDQPVLTPERIRELVWMALSDDARRRFEADLELDTSYTPAGESTGRFRVNVFVQQGVVGAVMRVIPSLIPDLGSLGLPAAVAGLANLTRGLVLVTGPTGSGKSTTLAALVDIVNRTRRGHIMTIEDPIEFVHVHKQSVINQREVGQDTRSFAAALKHVLRQDPDVILVGELRDLETISTALTAAETGHLVLGTLHTQSAAQSVDRLIDVFPAHQQQQIRTQLSATLRAVVTQQLVRAVGGGRVAAVEMLVATNAVRALIRDGKTHQITSSMQSGGNQGMQTMDHALAMLVRDGRVDLRVALEYSQDEDDLRRLIGSRAQARPEPATAGRR